MTAIRKTDIRAAMLLALAGFGMLSVGDAVVKSMAHAWPGPAVAALRYAFGSLFLCVLLVRREGKASFSTTRPWLHIGRGAAVAFASVFFFLSIFAMPLAEATAIQFINPMFVAIGSALFLGERASRAVWMSTAVAFAGVMIVLRPNVAVLGWAAFLPLLAAVGLAVLMILNRKAAGEGSALKMQVLVSVTATPVLLATALAGHVSGVQALHVTMPDWSIIGRCALVACTASASHALVYMATERASPALIAPMVYVQLIIAVVLGAVAYGDWPDLTAVAGSALIIVSGLWLWRHQTRGT